MENSPTRFAEQIQKAIDTQITDLWPIATALAAVGLFAFAILEAIKILPIRRWTNRWLFRKWLSQHVANVTEAETAIALLATGGDTRVLFSLPIERMNGQINAAVQTALAYPQRYAAIIRALARNADESDIAIIIAGIPADRDSMEAFVNARTRVSSVIQRNLDVVQIYIGDRWTLGNQIAAVAISTIAISVFVQPTLNNPAQYAKWVLLCLLGGMIAPVAKDIVASLKSLRDRAR